MRPEEVEVLRVYSEDIKNGVLSPQTAQIRKNDYIKMLESLQHYEISLGTDPNSRTIRNEAFRIEMLKRGWTLEDMPFMEAYFDSIENCTDPEVAQIGLQKLEELKNTEITTWHKRSEVLAGMYAAMGTFTPGDFIKTEALLQEAAMREGNGVEYPNDKEMQDKLKNKGSFNPYYTAFKKDKTAQSRANTSMLRRAGYEHNVQTEATKSTVRKKKSYVLPKLDDDELNRHTFNRSQKSVRAEMSQRDAIKQVFGDSVYEDIDSIYQADDPKDRTVPIHHSRGHAQLDNGQPVLELDFAGSGFAQARKEHHGFHGNIIDEDKLDAETARAMNAQYGTRQQKVGNIDTSDNHVRMKRVMQDGVTKYRYTLPGPSADNKGLTDTGRYRISNNVEIGTEAAIEFLKPLMAKWKANPNDPGFNMPVQINIQGHSRGAVASSETVIEIYDWLKKQEGYEEFTKHVNFELIQRDPVPGPDVWDHRRNYPDLRNIPNLKATTIYTTVADATLSGLFFHPQNVRGQERIIIGTTPHSAGLEGVDKSQMGDRDDGLAHQWGYYDAETKEYYRGSGITELPPGVYLTDEKRNLIRVTKYSQVDQVINRVNQVDHFGADHSTRQNTIRAVVKNYFIDNPDKLEFTDEAHRQRETALSELNIALIQSTKDASLSSLRAAIRDFGSAKSIVDKAEREEALKNAKRRILDECRSYMINTDVEKVDKKTDNNDNVFNFTNNRKLNAVCDLYCQLQSEENWQKQTELMKQRAEELKKQAGAVNNPKPVEQIDEEALDNINIDNEIEKNNPVPEVLQNEPVIEAPGFGELDPRAEKRSMLNRIAANLESPNATYGGHNDSGRYTDFVQSINAIKNQSPEITDQFDRKLGDIKASAIAYLEKLRKEGKLDRAWHDAGNRRKESALLALYIADPVAGEEWRIEMNRHRSWADKLEFDELADRPGVGIGENEQPTHGLKQEGDRPAVYNNSKDEEGRYILSDNESVGLALQIETEYYNAGPLLNTRSGAQIKEAGVRGVRGANEWVEVTDHMSKVENAFAVYNDNAEDLRREQNWAVTGYHNVTGKPYGRRKDQALRKYFTSEADVNTVKEGLRELKNAWEDASAALPDDPDNKRIKEYYLDQAFRADPDAGNYLKAMVDSPYLTRILRSNMSMPKLNSSKTVTTQQAIAGMRGKAPSQAGLPAGYRQDIYDLFMDYNHATTGELKVEYHRQELAKGGWSLEKENIYAAELKAAHKKTIEAFKKLSAVKDADQYTDFMDNSLSEVSGLYPGDNRDAMREIGYMEGELKALENGWTTSEMALMGAVGSIEAGIKKYREQNLNADNFSAQINVGNNRSYAGLDAFEEDFLKLKDAVWNRKIENETDRKEVADAVMSFIRTHEKESPAAESAMGMLDTYMGEIKRQAEVIDEQYYELNPAKSPTAEQTLEAKERENAFMEERRAKLNQKFLAADAEDSSLGAEADDFMKKAGELGWTEPYLTQIRDMGIFTAHLKFAIKHMEEEERKNGGNEYKERLESYRQSLAGAKGVMDHIRNNPPAAVEDMGRMLEAFGQATALGASKEPAIYRNAEKINKAQRTRVINDDIRRNFEEGQLKLALEDNDRLTHRMLQIKAGGEGIAQYEKDALDNFIKDLMKPDGPDGAFTDGKGEKIKALYAGLIRGQLDAVTDPGMVPLGYIENTDRLLAAIEDAAGKNVRIDGRPVMTVFSELTTTVYEQKKQAVINMLDDALYTTEEKKSSEADRLLHQGLGAIEASEGGRQLKYMSQSREQFMVHNLSQDEKMIALQEYRAQLHDTVAIAGELLNELNGLGGRSDKYNRLHEKLEAVKNLSDDNTPAQIKQALEDMSTAADDYAEDKGFISRLRSSDIKKKAGLAEAVSGLGRRKAGELNNTMGGDMIDRNEKLSTQLNSLKDNIVKNGAERQRRGIKLNQLMGKEKAENPDKKENHAQRHSFVPKTDVPVKEPVTNLKQQKGRKSF